MNIYHLFNSAWKQYTLLRAYENEAVRNLKLIGKGLDLGAKSSDAKYYEYIDRHSITSLEFVDYFHSGPGIVKMDLEEKFPIKSDQYDFVLSFNVMEHIYNYQQFLEESHRIIKDGGEMHGFVPLMWRFHPDPNDYFRFTGQALERLLLDVGFKSVSVEPVAAGPFKVAVTQIAPLFKFRILKFLLYATGVGLDTFAGYLSKGNYTYAMAYYFCAKKENSVVCED